MKVYFWDFHGVLEEGSELTLVTAINELRQHFGMFPDATIEELKSYFGPSLSKVVMRYFQPHYPHIHTYIDSTIRKLVLKHTESMMRPRQGAVETLHTIKTRGDLNYVLSSAEYEDILTQLNMMGLRPYLDEIYTFLHDGYRRTNNAATFKANMTFFVGLGFMEGQKNYSAFLENRLGNLTFPERLILIGDTRTDMEAAKLVKDMIKKYEGEVPKLGNVSIHGVLFDRDGKNSRIEADHRITRLEEVLYI